MGEGKIVPLVNKPYAVKTYWGMETKIHSFLTFAVDGNKWPVLHPIRFTPAERSTVSI
jgi:hypothetical protein